MDKLIKLREIINHILTNKNISVISELKNDMNLRDDIGFDSLDLAELTVRIEKEFGIDIFEDGMVETIEDILSKLEQNNE